MTEFVSTNFPETPIEIFRPGARLIVHSEPYTDPETGEKGFFWIIQADTTEELIQSYQQIVDDADVSRHRVVKESSFQFDYYNICFVTFHKLQTGEY